MAKPKIKPVVPGAPPTTEPAKPTAAQLIELKIDAICKTEFDVVFADQAEFDALEQATQDKLIAYYHRFRAAPKDPTAEQIQAGADEVIDAKLALNAGGYALLPNGDIDPTKLSKPVLTKDGWVCPAPKKA